MKDRKEKYDNSRLIMTSYGMNQFFGQWLTGPFGMFVFFFYEIEIGIDVRIAALAFILYSVWNAINDPLTGFLMERLHFPWEERWGKRFPWIVLGGLPWLLSYLLIFMVPLNLNPQSDKWIIFAWLLATTCLFDTFFTMWNVAVTAMYPDKFRGLNERRTAAGIATIIGITGIVSSSVVPPLFVKFGVPDTYRTAAWVSIGIGILIFGLMLPGILEDRKTRERYKQRLLENRDGTDASLLQSIKTVISDRLFVSKVTLFFGYQAGVALLAASAPYMINYVLGRESSATSIVMGGMLGGALVSIPLWVRVSHKLNDNRKLSILGGFAMAVTFLPMAFLNELYPMVAALFIFGIGLGAQWFSDPVTMGDVIDNATVKTGRRQEAIYFAYQTFFIRFGSTFQAAVFAVVHTMTGFIEGVKTRSDLVAKSPSFDLAIWGIRFHAAIIPAALVLVCTLIFWKYYDLTPEKVEENKKKLAEMGI